MELFSITRYNEDEEAGKKTSNEEELRKSLLKKIKQRKRLSKALKTEDTEDNDDNEIKRKRRKRDSEIQETQNINGKEKSENEKISSDVEVNDLNIENYTDDQLMLNQGHTGFTILQNAYLSKKIKVKRKLPNWLANPSVVSVDLKNLSNTVCSIKELDNKFIEELNKNGISHFFPVQSQVMPRLLQNINRPYIYWPNDICVSAPTGSGKTLAFVLPILQALSHRIIPRIRALVVLPVQDLANQVYKVFETYSKKTSLKVLLLSKVRTFTEEQYLICKMDSLGNYKTLVDIIVTTPGRLVEHLVKTKGFSLSDLKYLVIDEADRVMENVQNDWLYHVNKHINSECSRSYQVPIITYSNMMNKKKMPNKLLFSATLSQDPEKLQHLGLFHPVLFTSIVPLENNNTIGDKDETKFIGKYTTPAELKEYINVCTKAEKPLLMQYLLESRTWKNILCFVNSSAATTKLAILLKALNENKIRIAQLSANLTVKKRDSILNRFAKGEIDLLISSDALARGIDVPNVDYVISYDCPRFVKTYIHRIGRTARAGNKGTSLALLTSKEVHSFKKMISTAGKHTVEEMKIEKRDFEKYEVQYSKALEKLANHIKTKRVKLLKRHKNIKKVQTLIECGKSVKTKKNKRSFPSKKFPKKR